MPHVYLFREGVSKTPGFRFGLPFAFYRSMRASWSPVTVQVDNASEQFRLKTARRRSVTLDAGNHEFVVSGAGFLPATLRIEVPRNSDPLILQVEPKNREGASRTWPLGSLSCRQVQTPHELALYRFYASMPTSFKGKRVTHSVLISIAVSSAFALGGVCSLLVILWAALVRGPVVGATLLVPCSFMASVLMPIGFGGILAGLRFLQLPKCWR